MDRIEEYKGFLLKSRNSELNGSCNSMLFQQICYTAIESMLKVKLLEEQVKILSNETKEIERLKNISQHLITAIGIISGFDADSNTNYDYEEIRDWLTEVKKLLILDKKGDENV